MVTNWHVYRLTSPYSDGNFRVMYPIAIWFVHFSDFATWIDVNIDIWMHRNHIHIWSTLWQPKHSMKGNSKKDHLPPGPALASHYPARYKFPFCQITVKLHSIEPLSQTDKIFWTHDKKNPLPPRVAPRCRDFALAAGSHRLIFLDWAKFTPKLSNLSHNATTS